VGTNSTDPDAVQQLLDKQAITEALHRYCLAADRHDRALGYSVWHDDAVAHYENLFEGSGRDFVDFGIDALEQAKIEIASQHEVSNILIEVDGDEATSESYVTASMAIGGTGVVNVMKGQYKDSWSRRDGEWRIAERHYVTDIEQTVPASG